VVSPAEGGRVRRKSAFNIRLNKRPWVAAGAWAVVLAGAAWGASRAGLFAPTPPTRPPAAESSAAVPAATSRRSGGSVRGAPLSNPVRAESTPAATALPEAALTCGEAMGGQQWDVAFARCRAEADSSSAGRRNLGLLYAEGHGVARDDRLASVHLGLAAQDPVVPDTQAVVLMARRYEAGLGVAVDRAKAAGLWEVAAGMGVREAFAIIGERYAAGDGRRKSDSAAALWYTRAAQGGDVPSMTRLAESYLRGRGLRRDDNLARFWYSKAAELRDPEAEYQLALIMLKGKGGAQRDEVEGLKWLQRAADHGHAGARKELTRRTG